MREENRGTELGNNNLRNVSKADCKRERSRILGRLVTAWRETQHATNQDELQTDLQGVSGWCHRSLNVAPEAQIKH